MSKLKVIILDDEQEALDILSSLLKATEKVEIIKELQDPRKLESSIATLKPDAVFTDIQIPAYNGLEILENIRAYNPIFPVVYVTAHKKFALEASKHSPFDYLLKPVNRKELNHTIDHIISYLNKINKDEVPKNDKITLSVKDGLIYVNKNEIFSLIADGNYTNIKLTNGNEYLSAYNLGRIHEQIGNNKFVRINRQTVVNNNYLKEINKREKFCVVSAGDLVVQFDVSRTFLQNIKK